MSGVRVPAGAPESPPLHQGAEDISIFEGSNMTHTVALDPETEAVLTRRASRLGITISEYMARMAARSAVKRPSHRASAQQTGAQLIADLQAEGILVGYGDPEKNSGELARELRDPNVLDLVK